MRREGLLALPALGEEELSREGSPVPWPPGEPMRRRAIMPNLTDLLAEIGRLIDGQTVECVYGSDGKRENQYGARIYCEFCDGKGRIPNPALVPLLEVVRKPAHDDDWGLSAAVHYHHGGPYRMERRERKRPDHPDHQECECKGTDYVTRNWDWAPEWWLATLLIESAIKTSPKFYDDPVVTAQAVIRALGGVPQ